MAAGCQDRGCGAIWTRRTGFGTVCRAEQRSYKRAAPVGIDAVHLHR